MNSHRMVRPRRQHLRQVHVSGRDHRPEERQNKHSRQNQCPHRVLRGGASANKRDQHERQYREHHGATEASAIRAASSRVMLFKVTQSI